MLVQTRIGPERCKNVFRHQVLLPSPLLFPRFLPLGSCILLPLRHVKACYFSLVTAKCQSIHPWQSRPLQIWRSSEHWPKSFKRPASTAAGRKSPNWGAVYGPIAYEQGGASPHPQGKQNKTSNQTKKNQSTCLECSGPRHHEVSISWRGPHAPQSTHAHT